MGYNVWPLKSIFYFVFFWVGCLAALVNPIWGIGNYMIAYQVHPPVRWWGEPLTAIGMRFSWLAMLFIILGLVFTRRRMPKIRPALSLWEAGLLGLIAIGVLNTIFGIGFTGPARDAFEKFWKMQVFVLILGRLAITRGNLKIVIWTIVLGSLYLGHDAYTAPVWRFARGRLDVFGGPDTATSSGISAHLAAMLPIIGIGFLTAKSWKWKILAGAAGAFTVNAIILCRTRSAFIGLLVGALAAVALAPRARRYRIYLFVGMGLLAFSVLTDTHYRERMSTLADAEVMSNDPAVQGRSAIWRASARVVLDYPTGVGLGNFPEIIGHYNVQYWRRSSHNTIVTCFVELGILGGGIFLLLIFESVRLLRGSSKRAYLTDDPVETQLIAYGLLVSLVTYIVAGLATERFFCESFWWVLVFPQCLHRLVTNEARHGAEARELLPHDDCVEFGRLHGDPAYAI
jgi:hypothetical protein